MELTARQDKILSTVVRDYIRTGEPVGSKAIAEEIGVSSATVRNEMAELTELGLLEQPHTSAGRAPSQRGYREYVDRLMKLPPLREEERRLFEAVFSVTASEPERLLTVVCRLISGVSRCAGLVTTPSGAGACIRAVQLVQTGRRSAMLLLMSSAGTLKTCSFRCDFDLSHEMMRVLFRLLNEKVAGRPVAEITPAFLQTMAVSLGDMYALAAAPLRALQQTARDTAETQLLLSGQGNLLLHPELGSRGLLELLDRKAEMAELLRQKSGRLTVLIGRETGQPELETAALMVSRYRVGGEDAGALALLGPIRMDYARHSAVLLYLTAEVERILTALMRDE